MAAKERIKTLTEELKKECDEYHEYLLAFVADWQNKQVAPPETESNNAVGLQDFAGDDDEDMYLCPD